MHRRLPFIKKKITSTDSKLGFSRFFFTSKRLYNYQTTKERQMRYKQNKFQGYTQQVLMQKKEVANYDGFKMVEPLIDNTKEPHKLHLIKKIRSLKGEPWWVRNAMQKLGFDIKKEWTKTYSVRPNTPDINNLLWMCKHMIKLVPVSMLHGEPREDDVKFSKINLQTGELSVCKEIQKISVNDVDCECINGVPVVHSQRPSFTLDKSEIQRYLHRRRELCQLNDEYFPAVYDYKYDQDKPGVVNVKGLAHTSISQDE
jgi:hypothetical protein